MHYQMNLASNTFHIWIYQGWRGGGHSYVFFGHTEVQLSKLQIFFGIPFLNWQEYTLPILSMFFSLPFHPILSFLLLSSEFQLRQLTWRKLGINSTSYNYKEKNHFTDIFKDILQKALLLLGSKDYIVCFWHRVQKKSQLGNKIELVTGKVLSVVLHLLSATLIPTFS